jgi:hypothetical protein
MRNDIAASGIVAGIFIFVIIIVAALSFLMLTNSFETQYTTASLDPINNSGVLGNGTPEYQSVHTISDAINNNIPVAIFLAFLLAALLIVMTVWAILKRGE